MTFSSPLFFLLFLPFTLIGFEVLGRFGRKAAIGFLAFASVVFYSRWDRPYTLVLLMSILANFLFSIAIARSKDRPRQQTAWLAAGIVVNLAALCYFKYLFTLLQFFTQAGLSHREWHSILLPLGISFFTFTQIAYLVDLKQGIAQREGLLSYSLFVTFFPHLIAGPIIHHKEMMPQFREERRYRLNASDLALGLTWFTMGLFKKVMIADRISPFADAFYRQPAGVGASTAWLGVLTYSLQLYFDFSGYSDMALGLARMFSIRFPLNFNSPYKAQSVIDFWQRWHMTLTRYIMDYLYSPILFRVSRRRLDQGKKTSRKAMATLDGFSSMVAMPTLFSFLLVGIWHGAGLQFLLYGLLHGTYIVCNHAWRTFVPEASPLRRMMTAPVSVALTYLSVVLSFVLFRANSLRDAGTVYGDLLGRHAWGSALPVRQVVQVLLLLAIVWLMPNTQEILQESRKDDLPNWKLLTTVHWRPAPAWWLAVTAAFLLSMFYSNANATFLYFQF